MKQRHITKNRRRLTAAKPLAGGIFAALTASQSAQAIPFRDLPAYLQNTSTVSGTGKVRPNVVFLVDDSNFMNNGAGRTVIQHTFSDGKILIKVRDKNNNNAEIMRTLNPKNLMLSADYPGRRQDYGRPSVYRPFQRMVYQATAASFAAEHRSRCLSGV